ncbi:MAG: VWA domain-containing protein [Candidatus Marinimicrobia bacterium]|jgi:hypothetical protein|nr:VWA domain-containing protein [Candidatus Neomarinimicrobiota bacterium]|tara:strand:+ start:120 stop:1370 length:1251 start_codon:yes stop_codon:yes gene_type:complete
MILRKFILFMVLHLLVFSQEVKYKQIPAENNFLLVVDKSGSMSGSALGDAKIGLTHFISKMKTDDQAGLISFSSGVNVDVEITSNKSSFSPEINRLSAGGGTQLYDALASTVKEFSNSNGSRIVVYLTDGHDSGSNFSISHIESLFQGENIFLYGIGLGSVNVGVLQAISDKTGGEFLTVNRVSSKELKNIYANVLNAYYNRHNKRKSSSGTLIVKSIPKGKVVQINGENQGVTPAKITGLAPGTYTIDVYFDHGKLWNRDIEVKSGHSATIKAKEKDADKILWIVSKLHNATVFIDGEYVGKTSNEIVNTKKRKWYKSVKKNIKELKVTGIKPGRYTIEVIGFPDFDYGPEQKVVFEYNVTDDDVLSVDQFRNKIKSMHSEFSGKQRQTSFDIMDDNQSSSENKSNEKEEDIFDF